MREGAVLDRPVPGEEVAQVVAVAAQRRRREVVTRQAGQERRHPARFARRSASAACIARKVIPRVRPRFIACNTADQTPISRPIRLHAMIARNKQAVRA